MNKSGIKFRRTTRRLTHCFQASCERARPTTGIDEDIFCQDTGSTTGFSVKTVRLAETNCLAGPNLLLTLSPGIATNMAFDCFGIDLTLRFLGVPLLQMRLPDFDLPPGLDCRWPVNVEFEQVPVRIDVVKPAVICGNRWRVIVLRVGIECCNSFGFTDLLACWVSAVVVFRLHCTESAASVQ